MPLLFAAAFGSGWVDA